jgi:hypothetical protein
MGTRKIPDIIRGNIKLVETLVVVDVFDFKFIFEISPESDLDRELTE